jgi:uncharacterized protein (TIGR01777 family)
MKQVVLITGANGMLANCLGRELEKQYTVRFLTRNKSRDNQFEWNVDSNYIDPNAVIGVDHIIHLAGAAIADKRWTKSRKQIILSSRVKSANLILDELQKQKQSIESFISISAIGYYGGKTCAEVFVEESENGNDFLSNVCFEWERAAEAFKVKNVANKIAIVRTGIILDKKKGALSKIAKPIKFGFGSCLGSGKQYMPWIHMQDLVEIFKFILQDKNISGTFNAVAPQHVTNKEFTKTLAEKMHRSLFLPAIPKLLLKIIFGEMSTIILEGSKVSSEKIGKMGFKFKFKTLEAALGDLYKD